jgi:dolichyl-phosphate beta-glucosyltransferase
VGGSEAPEPVAFSVVFPAYREADRIPRALERAFQYLPTRYPSFEVIVVDDGSPDETTAVARETLAGLGGGRVITLPHNQGKGAAVRAGMLAARGERVLFSDADLSAPIEEERKLSAALDAGADVAIGSRAHPKAEITKAQGVVRQSMGRTFNVGLRVLGLTRFHDTQCGFKMFRREAARKIFSAARIDGFAFDVEVLLLATRAGYRVDEVPVEWENDPASRLHMIRDSIRMILEVVRIRWLYRPRLVGALRGRNVDESRR